MFRWFSRALPARRISGRPTSSNGASSFHLWWELPTTAPLAEVSAVLEVVQAPAVDRLYFWALQAGFTDGRARLGGGHLGLQWNRAHPGHGAVNWGGYAAQDAGGQILDGSVSHLPSARNDRNTRDYRWRPQTPYRLRIYRSPDREGAWRGEVTDIASGEATIVRDLYGGGSHLTGPVMWSEVFADCDHPSVEVKWSDMEVRDERGAEIRPGALRVNYQSYADGGCDNTTVRLVDGGVLQLTNVERRVPQGAVLRL